MLAGAAFGPRFGLLLGICAMAVSAVITGGIGPWLPFQMLGLGAMGAGAGAIDPTRGPRLGLRGEVVVLAVYGWVWGFVYGAILNLWSWPFLQGDGPTQWHAGLGVGATLQHYWSYYVATSFAWDAAGALFNALLILVTGAAILPSLRRFAHRLEPAVELVSRSACVGVNRAYTVQRRISSLRGGRRWRTRTANKRGVAAFAADELLVGAELDEPAVVDHRHPVGSAPRSTAGARPRSPCGAR